MSVCRADNPVWQQLIVLKRVTKVRHLWEDAASKDRKGTILGNARM